MLFGHGNSAYAANPESYYTIAGFGGIVSGVADYLQLDNVIYVGHSLGGHIILQSWDKFHSLKGLVVFGSTPAGVPPILDNAFLPHPALNGFFTADLSDEMVEIQAEALFKPGSKIPDFIPGNIRSTDPLAQKIIGESISKGLIRNELLLTESIIEPVTPGCFRGKYMLPVEVLVPMDIGYRYQTGNDLLIKADLPISL